MILNKARVEISFRYEAMGDAPVRIYAADAPNITMEASSELKTTFHGRFHDYRASGVDFLTDELRATAIINGDEYNLGYYIVTAENEEVRDGVTTIEVEAYSRLYKLKQSKIEARLHFAAGWLYTDALYALLTDAGITDFDITASTLTFSADREDWEVGTDRLTIINDLLAEMSYNSAYADNNGKIRLEAYTAATLANVDVTYNADRYSIIGPDYTLTNDRHSKPNVFMVICANPDLAAPLTSTLVNDSTDNPYSTAYRPRILNVAYVDSIASQEALDAKANELLQKSLLSDEEATFETMLNPEHSVYDILALGNGDLSGIYAETSWSMTLDGVSLMTHTARRTVGYFNSGVIVDTPKVLSYYGTITPLSVARRGMTAASVGNYALFGGGYAYGVDVVDAYDVTLTRTAPTVLSVARYFLAAASVGNYALFGGGYTGSAASAVVDAYDTALTRTTPTVLSAARNDLAAIAVGDYALFGGGATGTYSATVDAYDATLTRTTPTALSAARRYLAAAAVGDYALFGGGTTGTYSDTVDAYDTTLTRTTPAALSVARSDLVATAVGNYALFGGGDAGSASAAVDAYDTALTRTTPAALSVARYYLTATAVGDCALFSGGFGTSRSDIVDAYDASLTHTTPTALSVARYQLAAATVGDYLLFGGGRADSVSAAVDAYQYA